MARYSTNGGRMHLGFPVMRPRQGLTDKKTGKISAGGRILSREQKRWQVRKAFGGKG